MRTIGKFLNLGRTLDGNVTITFELDDDYRISEKVKELESVPLVIEIKKYFEKRSLSANDYFWKLCDEIAKKLNSDKDTIYIWMLKDGGGIFIDVNILDEAVEKLKKVYRFIEVMDDIPDENGMVTVRCYIGSSHYDKKEMGYLIDRAVREAKDLGIDTWTQDEINRVLSVWRAKK